MTNAQAQQLYRSILAVALSFKKPFTTEDFIRRFAVRYPRIWRGLIRTYGPWGKNAGRHYTAACRVADVLRSLSYRKRITKLRYTPASSIWGSPVIRMWRA